ncbi:hypothetical protein TNCV_1341511 [Trichonephila clavipes]|uniref:STPR domain-containing protein n=1 Tax=Trichonephila clavipes TaxID=2585209 RepID=A0A8X6V9Q7_TRICX|nr:hypothetical protein TNCV_1341511 [Trichonephila clavipes]
MRLAAMAQCNQERRAEETEEQKSRRLAAMAQRKQERREEETEEQRSRRLAAMVQRKQERREEETEEQRSHRLAAMANVTRREEQRKRKNKEVTDCQPCRSMQEDGVQTSLKNKIFMQRELFFTLLLKNITAVKWRICLKCGGLYFGAEKNARRAYTSGSQTFPTGDPIFNHNFYRAPLKITMY